MSTSAEQVQTLREGAKRLTRGAGHLSPGDATQAHAVAEFLTRAGEDIWAHGPLCECGDSCDVCDDSLWEPYARTALVIAEGIVGT